MINVEATKNQNENNASLIRRFTKRIRGSGVINRVKGLRYFAREDSAYTKKQDRLKKIARKKEVERLIKLGKMAPREARR